MDHTGFQRWLDAYVDAWRTYDETAIGELFTEDARYRYHPWEADDAVQGRAAIVANWLEDRDEPGSWTAEYRPWAIDGDRAVAAGVSRYLGADGETVEREYHNVFLCRFDGEGRCSEFTELYMRRDDG
ncbi:MAG: nuclear transport factor 2 family protein [Actinomycetota bacterium]|nr:nuclear transport factor 2 family protein [Actinomycetota bacterium]